VPGKQTCCIGEELAVEKHRYGIDTLSVQFHSYPETCAVWLPLHDKEPRLSPCSECHCVPAEFEDGAGDGEIQLEFTMSA